MTAAFGRPSRRVGRGCGTYGRLRPYGVGFPRPRPPTGRHLRRPRVRVVPPLRTGPCRRWGRGDEGPDRPRRSGRGTTRGTGRGPAQGARNAGARPPARQAAQVAAPLPPRPAKADSRRGLTPSVPAPPGGRPSVLGVHRPSWNSHPYVIGATALRCWPPRSKRTPSGQRRAGSPTAPWPWRRPSAWPISWAINVVYAYRNATVHYDSAPDTVNRWALENFPDLGPGHGDPSNQAQPPTHAS